MKRRKRIDIKAWKVREWFHRRQGVVHTNRRRRQGIVYAGSKSDSNHVEWVERGEKIRDKSKVYREGGGR